MTKGVLLMAYGTPRTTADILPYYSHIRHGRAPSPEQLAELTARYQAIGGTSPLFAVSAAQAAELQRQLGGEYRVFLGMKHWQPWIEDALADMAEAEIQQAVALVLAPHYSRLSVGDYFERIKARKTSIDWHFVPEWHLHPGYLQLMTSYLRHLPAAAPVLFTAHSLPERILTWDDPYPRQLRASAEAIAQALPGRRWDVAYQSAGRTPEPWLGPDLLEVLRRWAAEGVAEAIVCPLGFVSDHLEVLYDIDHEAKTQAAEWGLRLWRTPSPNADPAFIAVLADLVRQALPA